MQTQKISNASNILAIHGGEPTMSSLELRDIINAARLEHDEGEVRNTTFLRRVEDELSGELPVAQKMQPPQGGTPQRYYQLTRDQCTLVGMRESKSVRRIVLEKLKAMDSALPTIKDPQLAAIATMLTQLDTVKQEQASQRSEIADIRAKVETSPRDYYTVAGYASLRGINVDVKRASLLGRKAAKLSREYGVDIGEAHSEVFGRVNTYHVDILAEMFEREDG